MSKRQRESHLLLRRIRSSRQKYISLDDLKKKYGITDNEEKKALNKIEFGITFDDDDHPVKSIKDWYNKRAHPGSLRL